MREADLLCTPLRRKTRTTNSNHELRRYPNLYRNTIPIDPDRVWVGDLTYIPLPYGFAYLAVLLDACSRKVVGWGLSQRLDAKQTCAALKAALAVRTPAEGCIHHSDQGMQYASSEYVKMLTDNGFRISMSRRGNPYDNAQAESFMHTIKNEEVKLKEYRTFDDVHEGIEGFIEDVYNRHRLHSALGYRSPQEFEQAFNTKQDGLTFSDRLCTA